MSGPQEPTKYPHIKVLLSGADSAAILVGTVSRALRQAHVPADEITAFTDEANSGDYNHVLRVIRQTVEVRSVLRHGEARDPRTCIGQRPDNS